MNYPSLNKNNDELKDRYLFRLLFALFIAFIGYAILVTKLFLEQVQMGTDHMAAVDKQIMRSIRIPPRRGRIFDRNGVLLADTLPSYNLVLHFDSMVKYGRKKTIELVYDSINEISLLIHKPNMITKDDIRRHIIRTPGLPIILFKGLSLSDFSTILEMPNSPQGLELVAESSRHYPHENLASHILGWVGKNDPQLADDRKDFFYYQSDLMGRDALEKSLDTEIKINDKTYQGLRGDAGEEVIIVNSLGYKVDLFSQESLLRDGNNVRLTLDYDAQRLGESLMKDHKGALVILDAKTGDILAMVSMPTYNLNACVPFLSSEQYKTWLDDPARPLRSRALMEKNMPGSVIKPLVALAQMKKFASNTTEICHGYVIIGNSSIRCTGTHGEIDVSRALKVSCNSFFIYRGIDVGLELIQSVFENAKLGAAIPDFPLPMTRGTMPTRELKKRRNGTSWTPYDTGLISIGQGMIDVTPLQMAMVMAALGNDGVGYKPQLIKSVFLPDGTLLDEVKKEPYILLDAKAYPLSIVKGAMKAVTERGGTGARAKCINADLYAKTGTAEVGNGTEASPRRKNTWFTGYAKHVNGKTYAFASLIEDGTGGGVTNAPLVADFFNQWIPDSSMIKK